MPGQSAAGPGHWAGDHACLWLPGTPWWARAAGTPDGRGALEVYEGGELLDVVVDTPVAPRLLRGAHRAGRGDQAVAVAWGRVPVRGGSVTVRFTHGRLRARARPGWFAVRTTWCWIALAAGGFSHVVAIQADTRQQRVLARARAR